MNTNEESISSQDFARLCDLIYRQIGIRLGLEKKTMLEVRLKRRLKALEMHSYAQYCDYLFGQKGMKEEIVPLINVVTTNKTDFFREPGHFDYFAAQALPDLLARNPAGRPLLVWSSACSSGEEPFTLAIVMSEFAVLHPGFRFRILATDISTEVLAKAALGVYSADVVAPVPALLRRKYFLRSRDPDSNRLRVAPELRSLVDFQRLNLMDSDYGMRQCAGAIFCRNVLIYFDRSTQEQILARLCHCLLPGGYLFVGHSESLHDMDLPLAAVAPALYRRAGGGH